MNNAELHEIRMADESAGEDIRFAPAVWSHRRALLQHIDELVKGEGVPLSMLLWCPACGSRHIDEGEFADRPHHTHACQQCGMVWRPAIGPTVGVQFLPGFKNATSEPDPVVQINSAKEAQTFLGASEPPSVAELSMYVTAVGGRIDVNVNGVGAASYIVHVPAERVEDAKRLAERCIPWVYAVKVEAMS